MSGAVRRGLILFALLMVFGAARNATAQTSCDRACLTRTADEYFAAMVAHDPSKAPMAANVRFTEQKIEATGAVLPFNSKNGWTDFMR